MARSKWAEIPLDWLVPIIRRVPCPNDRRAVRNVSKHWRSAVVEAPPAPLPWLLVPSDPAPTLSCVLSQGEIHELVADHVPPRGRYFGSCDGTWVLAALDDNERHIAFNLTTGATVTLANPPRDHSGKHLEMFFATLSSAPDGQYVAAGVAKTSSIGNRITFWRHRDQVTSLVDEGNLAQWSPSTEVEDAIFYNDEFFFLTSGEELRICAPVFTDNGDLQAQFQLLPFPDGSEHMPGYDIVARYLVASREKMLLVVRYSQADMEEKKTINFAVFEMVELDSRKSFGKLCNTGLLRRGNDHEWHQLPTLDGRILFVGRGCSRSYEAAQYPGFSEGVYFLDQDLFQRPEGRYSCDDNGRWSATSSCAKNFFRLPAHSSSSTYSCPIWVLPPGLQSDGNRRNLQEGANLPGVARNTKLRIEDGAASDDEDVGSDDEDAGSDDEDPQDAI